MNASPGWPILIGHNDTLLSLYVTERGKGRSFFTRSDIGHIDLPRAKAGGMAGGFFAIFVPQDPLLQPMRRDEVIETDAGYDDISLRKLSYENWIRVLSKTWK